MREVHADHTSFPVEQFSSLRDGRHRVRDVMQNAREENSVEGLSTGELSRELRDCIRKRASLVTERIRPSSAVSDSDGFLIRVHAGNIVPRTSEL